MSWASIPGLVLARRMLMNVIAFNPLPSARLHPRKQKLINLPKVGLGGTKVWIPSTAFFFFFTDPCCLPCAHDLILPLPAWNGPQVIETPPCLEIALSFPPHPAFPVAILVTHPNAHWLEVFGHVFLATCMMKWRKEVWRERSKRLPNREELVLSLRTFLSLVALTSWGLTTFPSLGSVYPYTKFPFSA